MVAVRAASVKSSSRIGAPFSILTHELMERLDLSWSCKGVFQAVANHARIRGDRVSTWTNRRIARATGLSVAAVRRALESLELAGLIRRVYGASIRVRLGVEVLYGAVFPGDAQGCATPPAGPAPGGRPGGAGAATGVAQGCATDLGRMGGERSKSVVSTPSPGEERPGPPLSPEAAGAYLRAVRKGRTAEAEAILESHRRAHGPGSPAAAESEGQGGRTGPGKSEGQGGPARTSPPPGPDPVRRVLRDMAASLFAPADPPRPRRPKPCELERMLAERRRARAGSSRAPSRVAPRNSTTPNDVIHDQSRT